MDHPLKFLAVFLLPISLASIFLIGILSPAERPEHPQYFEQVSGIESAYDRLQLIVPQLDSLDAEIRWHRALLEGYPQLSADDRNLIDFELFQKGIKLPEFYERSSRSELRSQRELGQLCLVHWEIARGEWQQASELLVEAEVQAPENLYQKALLVIALYPNDPEAATRYLQRAAEDENLRNKALAKQFELYVTRHDWPNAEEALAAVGSDEVDIQLRIYYYRKTGRFLSYLISIPQLLIDRATPAGLAGAALVLFIWLLYLFRAMAFEPIRMGQLAWGLSWGAIGTLSALYLYSAFDSLGLKPDGNGVVDQLLYYVGNVGLIEELVKLFPLLAGLLFFRARLKTPLAYLKLALFGAIVFAALENIDYFRGGAEGAIIGRGIFTTVGHLADTAIAAYGLILFRFRPNKKWILIPAYFLSAVCLHGFYDLFFVINVNPLVSVVIWAVEVAILVSILNNCFNVSPGFDPARSRNIYRASNIISAGITLSFIGTYAYLSLSFGRTFGTLLISGQWFLLISLLPFLALRLSRIHLTPGRWDILSVSNYSKLLRLDKVHQKSVVLKAFRKGSLSQAGTMTGKSQGYHLHPSGREWLVVRLDAPLNIGTHSINLVLLKPKEAYDDFSIHEEIMVHLRAVRSEQEANLSAHAINTLPFVNWAWCQMTKTPKSKR